VYAGEDSSDIVVDVDCSVDKHLTLSKSFKQNDGDSATNRAFFG